MVYYMEQIEEKSTISLEDDINIPPPPTMPAWATRELASLAECEVIYLVLFIAVSLSNFLIYLPMILSYCSNISTDIHIFFVLFLTRSI